MSVISDKGITARLESMLTSGWGIIFILTTTALVYSNSLFNGFVWDDKQFLVLNEAYRRFDLLQLFLTRMNGLEYMPFRDLTYLIDYQLWGMNPFGFRLTGLVFYLTSLFILWRMVKDLVALSGQQEQDWITFWTTLVFALHPLHAEALNFVYGRGAILSGLFLFLSLHLFIKGLCKHGNKEIIFSLLAFIIAVFTKTTAIFYPAFLAVITPLMPKTAISVKKRLIVLMSFFMVDILAIWVHFRIAAAHNIVTTDFIVFGSGSLWLKIARALQIPFFYIWKFILPYPLSITYSETFMSANFILWSVLSGIFLVVILYITWIIRRKRLPLFLGAAWCLFSFSPVLNIFQTSTLVADRYAYLPLFGFGLLFAYGFQEIFARQKLFVYIALSAVLIWSVIVFKRNMDWHSDVTLWESALRADPAISKVNLAEVLWEEGRREEALRHLRDEQDKTGSFHYFHYQGKYLYISGRYHDAVNYYKEALNRGGDALKTVHLDLAKAYEKAGMDMQALEGYLKVLETRRADILERNNRMAKDGLSRVQARLMPALEDARRKALAEPMSFQAQAGFALALHKMGLYEDAEKFYLKSLQINPSSWEASYNLGIIYQKQQRYADAVVSFEKSLSSNPLNKDALNNAGICYMAMNNYPQAIWYYERALKVDPSFFYAAFNLGRAYFTTGNRQKARQYFYLSRTLTGGNATLIARIAPYIAQLK